MHNDMVRKSYWIIGWLALCGILIVAVAMWLGPDTDKNALSESATTTEQLPAPLAPDKLAAYDDDMTNNDNPVAVITTNKGVVELELFEDAMPITAGNFKNLANKGFYNGTKFHRVIQGFMIQGGDPLTKEADVMKYGTGGPGYSIQDEFVEGEKLSNVRGTIAMANSGPNTGGSQFFINLIDNKQLDFNVPDPNNSQHPVFGRVVKGMEIVDAISQVQVGPRDMPVDDIIVEKVEIREAS